MMFRSGRVAARARACAFVGLSALLLAACGGGGDGSPAAGDGPPSTPAPGPAPGPAPAPSPAPSPIPGPQAEVTIVGTTATGVPLAGAAISLKCVGTNQAVSADANGAYRIASVPVDAMPCLLQAQQGSTVYVSPVATADGGTININITPLTHLLSSRLLGQPGDLAFRNAAGPSFALVNPSGISAARGYVRAQLDRLGIVAAGLSSDWIGTPFQARPGDSHDELLEALGAALASHGLTVPTAAGQIASSEAVLNLPPDEPVQACTPALLDGFAGTDRSKWLAPGTGPIPSDGIGIGGGPGFTRGASVEVSFADGTVLRGARTDAVNGMVTLVPCGLKALPALIRMRGEPGATYYDAGNGQWVSFEGQELHGLVQGFEVDRNLAVTPFTEAIYQRVLALGTETGAASVAVRFAAKSTGPAWQDSGRIELAHDEVLAAVNDQLPGVYRLGRLEHMPLLLDEQGDTEGSQALPKTPDGIHAAVIAGFAKAAAASRPGEPAPALGISERFAADLADGILDNPFAGLDISTAASMLPAYSLDSLWRALTAGTTGVAFKAGRPEYRSELPFPLALVKPSGYRVDDMFATTQYAGLYSDGVLRIVAEVRDDYPPHCGYWCNPVRKVRASADSAWWVFEIGRFLDFDITTRIARRHDGSMVSVGTVHADVPPESLLGATDVDVVETFPNVHTASLYRSSDGGIHQRIYNRSGYVVVDYAELRGLNSLAGMPYSWSTAFLPYDDTVEAVGLHLFGIAADGSVQRLVYSFPDYQAEPVTLPALKYRSIVDLPSRARQLTSDGRLVYALLADGSVYLLNPEILVSEAGGYPQEGVDPEFIQRSYVGRFRPAPLAGHAPLRIQGASNICRIDGIYLVTCGGQLRRIDRSYYWLLVSYPFNSIRAPGAEYMVVSDTRFDARGWRALKVPLTAEVVWEDAYFRLLMTVNGSYVLQEDTYDIRLGAGSYEMSGSELSQQVVESWLGG